MKSNKNSTLKRVKVYLLTDVWVDNGTGYCFSEVNEQQEPYLVVKNELDESDELLRAKIEGSIQFQRQQETLIVWSDSNGQNIALSFQEKAGCASLCNFLIKVNRNNLAPFISLVYIIPTEPEGCEISEFITGPINYPTMDPTSSDLLDIFQRFNENPSSSYQRECIVKFIEGNDYITKLTQLFNDCEQAKQIKSLHILCNIIKTLILYNEVTVLELLLEDKHIMGVVGILEYDPDFPLFKANHRTYLKDDSKFKEVLPIKNDDVKRLIIKTFKLQFLKDVVLVRLLDDPTFNFISTLIHFNHVKIMEFLEKSNFINDLFQIYNEEGNLDKKQDGIKLIHQFILISKNLQPHQKTNLYKSLVKKGLLRILSFVLEFNSVELRVLSTEILVSIIEHDVLLVSTCITDDSESKEITEFDSEDGKCDGETQGNEHITDKPETFNGDEYGDEDEEDLDFFRDDLDRSNTEKPSILSEDMTLLSMLTDFLLAENAPGLRIQSFEALKSLLDPMNNLNVSNSANEQLFIEQLDTESYFNAFYTKVAPKLFKPLIDESTKEFNSADFVDKKMDDLFIHLSELIIFCSKDKSVSRSFFLENHILMGVSKLIKSNHKSQLQLASVRSIKSIILLNDDYYTRYIISNDLMKPVFELFGRTKDSENLIYSTILDLLETILLEIDKNNQLNCNNFKLLANYIVENYKQVLESIDTVHSGEDLIRFVEVGEVRKNGNDIDISVEFDESINENNKFFSSDELEREKNTDEAANENNDNDDGESVIPKAETNPFRNSEGNTETTLGKENLKQKRLREDDILSLKKRSANGSKKKVTLKSKISSASKKIASKFSSTK
jgi:protein phosphatase-4 regulatory subunit 3